MARGYVYALINPSIKDTVKVGKTTRDPDGRAAELSGATGVATPFIVAYSEFFEDCDEAEQFVHTLLETGGHRVAPNREFFSAPLENVVKAINQAAGQLALADPSSIEEETGRSESTGELSGADLGSTDAADTEPWLEFFNQAQEVELGTDGSFQDFDEAIELYEKAAQLGGVEAYARIGMIYSQIAGENTLNDPNVRTDVNNTKKAIHYYKLGAENGNWHLYNFMASNYLDLDDKYNANIAYERWFKSIAENVEIWGNNFDEFDRILAFLNDYHEDQHRGSNEKSELPDASVLLRGIKDELLHCLDVWEDISLRENPKGIEDFEWEDEVETAEEQIRSKSAAVRSLFS